MRAVIVGATTLGVTVARKLIDAGNDVVMIDRDRAALDAVSDGLDCGLIEGDGTLPSTLRNAAGEGAATLLALTNHDEDNVLSALVGRSVGYKRVIPKVLNAELGAVCTELGLDEAVFAEETMATKIVNGVEAAGDVEMRQALGDGLQLVWASAAADGRDDDLDLPDGARLLTVKRDGAPRFAGDGRIEKGDGLLFLAQDEVVATLRKRFTDPAGGDA